MTRGIALGVAGLGVGGPVGGLGPFAASIVIEDSGGNSLDGTAIRVNCCGSDGMFFDPSADGGNSYCDLPEVGIEALWDGAEVMAVIEYKVANLGVWTDGVDRKPYTLRTNTVPTLNYLIAEKGPSRMRWYYRPNDTLEQVEKLFYTDVTWETHGSYCSDANDDFKAYLNGAQEGATQHTIATWNNTFPNNGCTIGANIVRTNSPWHGWLRNFIFTLSGADITGPDAKMADIHTKLAAGTLTPAHLDTHFGADKWAWWKLDETP